MMRSARIVGAMALLGVLGWFGAHADVVMLKTGERKVGVVKQTKGDVNNIEFTDATGTIKIPLARISKIEDEPEHASYLHIGNQYLEQNNLFEARRYFSLARNEAPDDPDVKAALDKVEAAIQLKEADDQKIKEELMDLELKNVRQLISDKQFDKAADKTRFLIGVARTDDQKAQLTKQLANVYYQWGLDRQDKLDPVNAAVYLSKSYELDPTNKDAFDRLLALWERDPARTEDVIKVYRDRLRQNPDDLVTMVKLANQLAAQGNHAESLPMFVTLYQSDTYRNAQIAAKLSRAYEEATKALVEQKNFLGAADLHEQYVNILPGTDPTPIYLYEYADKLTKIDANKIEDRLALGDFAKSKGLLDQAKREYKAALDLAPENQKALQELTIFAQRDLNSAQQAAQRGNYIVAITIAQDVQNEYTYLPAIIQQANDLITKADIEYKRDMREKREQAQELIRKGDEYFSAANFHMNAMKNIERSDSRRPVSDKIEAINNFELALRFYKTAYRLDPSTNQVEYGDVANKIRRTEGHLSTLKNPVPLPMPRGSSPSGQRIYR